MVILADSGVSTAVMSQAGKVWTDKIKLGEIISTGLNLRKKFATVSIIVAVPILVYLLRTHGADWITAILIVLALIPVFITTLSNSLLEVAPRLQQDIKRLQHNQLKASLGRLASLAVTLLLFPLAFASIIASSFSQIWANVNLRRISKEYVEYNQLPNADINKEIVKLVKSIAPYSIYYCLSGQISLWLLSFLGTTNSIAQIGALGRVSMAISFFTVLFNILIIPRFARLDGKSKKLAKNYVRIQLLLFVICLVILGLVYLFPNQILWILGKNYSNLEEELFLSVANSCIGMIAGISFVLCTSRGWVINAKFAIPINLLSIIFSAMITDVSTLKGVLIFNIIIESIIAVMNILYGYIKTVNSVKESFVISI